MTHLPKDPAQSGRCLAKELAVIVATASSPYQVAMMARVLGAICKQHGLVDQVDRDKIAARIVALFELGVTRGAELLAQPKQVIN